MSTAVNDIIDRAELILQDITNVRWTATELINWLNDGHREVVLIKPEANTTNESVQLTSGTKQTLPSGGICLLDIIRNMGSNGTTPGNAIRLVDRRILDDQVPGWHSETASAVTKHFMFDERDPTHYYVYPQSDGTNYIEVVYSSAPTTVAAGENISIPDIYANALIDYILYRAYSKDADYAENSQRAVAHYQAFTVSLGAKNSAESTNDPNLRKAAKVGAPA